MNITHIVGIDLETTDISIETGAIVEIGAVRIKIADNNWEAEEEYNSLCRWESNNERGTTYLPKVQKITKITNFMILSAQVCFFFK